MIKVYAPILFCALISIIYSLWLARLVLSSPTGNAKMQQIALAIQEGASAYLNRQYKVIAIIGFLITIMLTILLGSYVGIGFAIGAILSGVTGYIGMNISVRSNVRTAEAARTGAQQALDIAFRSGVITGLSVVTFAIIGIVVYFVTLQKIGLDLRHTLEALVSLGFGASLISIFARLGGGIFTKGADIGADLVGKIEIEIPEDDPRNPAVIADNVGDNVGDCAGMAADLFETYVVTLIGTILLAGIYFTGYELHLMLFLPMLICGICILASIIGTFFVKLDQSGNIFKALYRGYSVTAVCAVIFIAAIFYYLIGFSTVFEGKNISFTGLNLFYCCLIGLLVTTLIIRITEYYTMTSFRPVRSIAKASLTGHGTNIIQGIAISMEATALPVIFICFGILFSFKNAGLFGISIASTTMLSLAGIIIALDAYGPVTDNAGGIAEMSKMPSNVRKITDALDSVGNTTKAITKGYAIGSAGFASLVLFAAFIEDIKYYFPQYELNFSLENANVVTGLFIGGLLPYIFGSLSLMSVGRAAQSIVIEVRRQFREILGIMDGSAKPEYGKAVDILTRKAIFEMIVPGLLPVAFPILLYLIIRVSFGQQEALLSLGSMLLGSIVTGLFVGLSMTSGGGAWDNAKKYIESGFFGGKGSDAHKASITGDTVGDPYKDTAGPAINPMIKIANIVAILLLAVVSKT